MMRIFDDDDGDDDMMTGKLLERDVLLDPRDGSSSLGFWD